MVGPEVDAFLGWLASDCGEPGSSAMAGSTDSSSSETSTDGGSSELSRTLRPTWLR